MNDVKSIMLDVRKFSDICSVYSNVHFGILWSLAVPIIDGNRYNKDVLKGTINNVVKDIIILQAFNILQGLSLNPRNYVEFNIEHKVKLYVERLSLSYPIDTYDLDSNTKNMLDIYTSTWSDFIVRSLVDNVKDEFYFYDDSVTYKDDIEASVEKGNKTLVFVNGHETRHTIDTLLFSIYNCKELR